MSTKRVLRPDGPPWPCTLCLVPSVIMFCFVFFHEFQLPIGLHSSYSISPTSNGTCQKKLQNITTGGTKHSVDKLLAAVLLTLGRVELDAVLLAPAGVVDVGRGGGDHPVVVVDLLESVQQSHFGSQFAS